MTDERCQRDGAYCRDPETGILYRCLGERIQDAPGDPVRVGYENALDPDIVRWVTRRSVLAVRMRFVVQGEPSTDREIVEAMR
jgi:hypothetical protein